MTPYLEYHPGGIPEIMRGAGRDGTDLFDEVRRSCSFGSFHFLSAPPLRMAGFRPLKVLAAPFEGKNPKGSIFGGTFEKNF